MRYQLGLSRHDTIIIITAFCFTSEVEKCGLDKLIQMGNMGNSLGTHKNLKSIAHHHKERQRTFVPSLMNYLYRLIIKHGNVEQK